MCLCLGKDMIAGTYKNTRLYDTQRQRSQITSVFVVTMLSVIHCVVLCLHTARTALEALF